MRRRFRGTLAAALVVACGGEGAGDANGDAEGGTSVDGEEGWGYEHSDSLESDSGAADADASSDSDPDGPSDGDESEGDGDAVPYADTVPEGVDIACGNLAYPFELDPLAPEFTARNAYWTMWMSWRAKLSGEAALADELATLGFDEFASIDIGNAGLQAFVAGSDDMVVVSFRGSQEILDWLVNLNFPQKSAAPYGFEGRLHQGFADTLQAGWLDVLSAVSSFADPNMPIVVTGQSLGGAMATLAASRLAQLGYRVAPVYVFGNPRVGDVQFADEAWGTLEAPMFRWVND